MVNVGNCFRAQGWDDFIERLTNLIVNLPVRRRQALVMLLFDAH